MSDDNDPDDASFDTDEVQATTDPSIQNIRSDSRHPRLARLATVIVMALAGLMMTTAAINSRGRDLRPERDTDMATLVRSQASHRASFGLDLGSSLLVGIVELAEVAVLKRGVWHSSLEVTVNNQPVSQRPRFEEPLHREILTSEATRIELAILPKSAASQVASLLGCHLNLLACDDSFNLLQALLEIAPVVRAGQEGPQVEGVDFRVLQETGGVTVGHALR